MLVEQSYEINIAKDLNSKELFSRDKIPTKLKDDSNCNNCTKGIKKNLTSVTSHIQ
jgi:hypothetical protein